jgi:hypothetical protein
LLVQLSQQNGRPTRPYGPTKHKKLVANDGAIAMGVELRV